MEIKRIFLLCALAAFLFGCSPEKRCAKFARYCPQSVRDSIVTRTETIYKDTTIYVSYPEIIIQSDTIPILVEVNKPVNLVRQVKKMDNLTVWAEIKNSRLLFGAQLTDTTFRVDLRNALRETQTWKERYQSAIIKTPPEKFIPKIYRYALWLAIAALLYLIYRVAKLFKPFI